MKKGMVFVLAVLLIPAFAMAKWGTIEANLSYFYPAFEEAFQDIYGGGWAVGGNLTLDVWKNLGIWFGVSSFSKTGELTFTKEETKVSMMPIALGAQYTILSSPVSVYAGLGVLFLHYKESNILGEVKDWGFGFEAKAGAYKKLIAGFFAELFISLSHCEMKPADFKFNVGGLKGGIGIGYEF